MQRTIFHIDLNNFYASVECLYRPELRHRPIAVCGDVEARHGIVLAKNYPAKQSGVKTGEAIWQAKQKCPGLITVPPDFRKYLRFSRLAKLIYADYTDQIEPFGIDEAWLDMSRSLKIFGDAHMIATEIRRRLREEIGITGSIGISFNKIFAKLGSDLNKPDATTVITENNFQKIVWPLPVGELLYVGRSTQRKLENRAIFTVGDLAKADVNGLRLLLGVWGETLWNFANGYDAAVVRHSGEEYLIKSVGNSTTTARDLRNEQDAKLIIFVLSESIAARLRELGLKCTTVAITIRNIELVSCVRQGKLTRPSFLSAEIAQTALELLTNYNWDKPIRSLGVRGCDLVTANEHIQLNLFEGDRTSSEELEKTVDGIRARFGHYSVRRCSMLLDRKLTGFSPKEDHVIHPVSFFR